MAMQFKANLKPLLDSSNGIHLTSYFKGGQGLDVLKSQIQAALEEASDHLSPVLKPHEEERFLDPIRGLLRDDRLLQQLSGNIGIFRTSNSFRVLSLPVEVEETCVVATTFHVKPLLRWMQMDQEFILVGIDDRAVYLYRGNLFAIEKLGEYKFSKRTGLEWLDGQGSHSRRSLKGNRLREALSAAGDWMVEMTRNMHSPLFIAGNRKLTQTFSQELGTTALTPCVIGCSFSKDKIPLVCSEIRAHLRVEVLQTLEKSLIEFQYAEQANLAKRNIFEIAKAAVRGRVRKLLIADGIQIFGTINRSTGGLSIHPNHLNHEDDDILDDLAQEVLAQGGDVMVAHRNDMPAGEALLAIYDEEPSDLHLGTKVTETRENRAKLSESWAV